MSVSESETETEKPDRGRREIAFGRLCRRLFFFSAALLAFFMLHLGAHAAPAMAGPGAESGAETGIALADSAMPKVLMFVAIAALLGFAASTVRRERRRAGPDANTPEDA